MNFESSESERLFREHFHRQRVPQDRVFALTQMAIVTLLVLHTGRPLAPPMRLLFWGTHVLSGVVLVLSVCGRQRYAAVRPRLLVAARLFYDLLCPQLVWHLATQHSAVRGGERGSWPGFFLLWVTWTRWGSELLTQVGYLLPFNLEALLTPFGALLDMLNNRRLCRLLTMGDQPEARPFYRDAFARLATRLSLPFEVLFAAAPEGTCGQDGGCPWNLCTAAAAGGGGSATAADDVATCHCESVFSLTQLVLSVLLPLLLVGYAEASQRRQFAAAQLQAASAAEREDAEGLRVSRRRRRLGGSAAWCISFDGMRLLALLALIQFRIFLSLRFGVWQQYGWASGVGDAPAAPPAPVHTEL